MFSPVRLVQLSIFLYSFHQVRTACKSKLFIKYLISFQTVCKVEFANIKCVTLDPEFADFDYCYLKAVSRTYKYLSLRVKLLETPITKIKVRKCSIKI